MNRSSEPPPSPKKTAVMFFVFVFFSVGITNTIREAVVDVSSKRGYFVNIYSSARPGTVTVL